MRCPDCGSRDCPLRYSPTDERRAWLKFFACVAITAFLLAGLLLADGWWR